MIGPKLTRLIRFALAGVAGLVVDVGVLTMLIDVLGPVGGRAVSFLCAVLTTWTINRNFAFSGQRSSQSLPVEFARYLASMMVGGAVNWCAYGVTLWLLPPGPLVPAIGVGLGSIAGLFVNLALAQRFVFR